MDLSYFASSFGGLRCLGCDELRVTGTIVSILAKDRMKWNGMELNGKGV